MMEQISKSQVFFEGWLPGAVKRLRNHTYVQVKGARNDSSESRKIDRDQLIAIVSKVVEEWNNLDQTSVDITLMTSLQHAETGLEVVCPNTLYVDPFPIMLRCNSCNVLDYHSSYKKEEDHFRMAKNRLKGGDTSKSIPCRRSGCHGTMLQLPYVAIHRCGNLTPIDIPYQIRNTKNLGYNDGGGTFLNHNYFEVDSGMQLAHSLQQRCEGCKGSYSDSIYKQGRLAGGSDILYPHYVQYLSLKEDSAKMVSKTSGFLDTMSDLSNAITSTLIGRSSANELAQFMDSILQGDNEEDEDLLEKLAAAKRTREDLAASCAVMPAETLDIILGNADELIAGLESKVNQSSSHFSEVCELFPDQEIINEISASRRSIEAALLPYDYSRERDTFLKMLQREVDHVRKDRLNQDIVIIKNRYGIRDISHYRAINVVLSCYGYTRELMKPVEHLEGKDVPPLTLNGFEDQVDSSLTGKNVIYALPAQTEAIQLHIDACKLLRWCVNQAGWDDPGEETLMDRVKAHAYLLSHSEALRSEPSEVRRRVQEIPISESAPFHLIHTISHCLISTIKRHTGYDEKRVMEYLIPMDLSIVLYIASVQNYTAGGLLTLFNHHLREWLDEASNYAFNCIFDPLCSDRGASCSGCIQTVMGCETFNHGLSRSYLHGGKVDDNGSLKVKEGFWS